ncbi:winged helix-turn-helix domain-containing protein [Mesorhizobium sp. A623]
MSFGPFRLSATERLLTRDGARIDLGARALDILICLLSRPNDVFSKQELLARVWPDVVVEEGSLRFQIARLRKTLGDGVDGASCPSSDHLAQIGSQISEVSASSWG